MRIKDVDKLKIYNLDRQLEELTPSGTSAGWGTVDIKFAVYDPNNQPDWSVEVVDEPVSGVLLSDYTMRDRMRLFYRMEKKRDLRKAGLL